MTIKAPYLPYDELVPRAESFLAEHHPSGAIPVPIEAIVEFHFQIDIIELQGLKNLIDVDAFLTSNLRELYVDQHVYRKVPNRYRFSLAHELAHVVLHQNVFAQLKFSTIEEWRDVIQNAIPKEVYAWIEHQAYDFAGLILVPPAALEREFQSMIDRAKEAGITKAEIYNEDSTRKTFETYLGEPFGVSWNVIDKRLDRDGLWLP